MANTPETPITHKPTTTTTPTANSATVAPTATTATPGDAKLTDGTHTATTGAPNPVKSNWNEQKGKLKTKFSTLTDADLHYENGKKDEMMTKIQTKLGKTKEELDTIISAL